MKILKCECGRQRAVSFVLAILLVFSSATGGFADVEYDVVVPEFHAPKADRSDPTVYEGTPYPQEIVDQVYYEDINHISGKREIVRMTALGAINAMGSREFRPDAAATGYEALAMLAGLSGGVSDMLRSVQDQAGTTTSPERMKSMLNRAFYDAAAAKGMVQPNEMLGLERPISRERAALFLARAIGLDKDYDQTKVYTFQDWLDVEPYARAPIEGLVKKNVLPLKADGTFSPRENITRGELALWMSGAFDHNPGLLGAEVKYGVVVGKRQDVRTEGAEKVTDYVVSLTDPDGKPVELRTSRKSSGLVNDFIVYRNGIVSVSHYLEIGDEIEYILIGGKVRYAGTIENGQVLSHLARKSDIYDYVHYGRVADIRRLDQVVDGKTVSKESYRIADISGNVLDIVVYDDGTSVRNDIITYKNGAIGGVKLLAVGDTIEYITNENNEVGYIKVKDLEKKEISGTMNRYEPHTETAPAYVTIYGYDDKMYRYALAPYAVLTINGRPAPLQDFLYGLSVNAKIVGDVIFSLRGESYSGEPGYIPPFGKIRMGKVDYIRSDNNFRIIMSGGAKEEIFVDADTVFTKNNSPSRYRAIKVGDEVKVYYNSITGKNAAKIEMIAPEKYFDKVYKGKLSNILPQSGELYLMGSDGRAKPEYIANDDFQLADTYTKELTLSPNCEIYVENKKITPEELERLYKGYQIYAVTNEEFGKEVAVRISVKRGAEMMYNSTVASLDHTLGEMELFTRDNFEINSATIVIKDGRVVPTKSLKKNDTVFVLSESPDGAHSRNALLVKVTSKKDFLFDNVRIGAIETVGTSSLNLRNYTFMTNKKFEAVNPNLSGYFNFTTDSVIKDITDPEKVKTIKPTVFFHNKYARSENYDKTGSGLKYKRYYTFMVINPANNTVLAMNMRKGGLMPLNLFDFKLKKEEDIQKELAKAFKDAVVTRGVIVGRDELWQRFELSEAYDFTSYRAQWKPTGTNIYVKHQDAIIIKNDRVIGKNEIQVGDYVYILRIGTDSLIIYVE